MNKLDPTLQRLIGGEDPSTLDVPSRTRSDGTTVYSVLVRTDDLSAIREAGLPTNSASGPVATARWSIDEIRRAARLPAVRSIEASGRATSAG